MIETARFPRLALLRLTDSIDNGHGDPRNLRIVAHLLQGWAMHQVQGEVKRQAPFSRQWRHYNLRES
jgi:hypothetical protein